MRGTEPVAISFGESVIDIYPDRRVVAGSPLHLAAHLARAGWRCHILTRIGDDDDGRSIASTLETHGVEPDLVQVDRHLPTGTVTIELRGETHSFEIHGPAAWEKVALPAWLPDHDALCYGTLVGRSAVSATTLRNLLQASRARLKVLDLNLRPPDLSSEVVRTAAASATIIKAAADEFRVLADCMGTHMSPPAIFLAAPSLRWFALTRGANGAELWHVSGDSWRSAASPVEVVDTVGAGDAFTSGLLDAVHRGLPGDRILEHAIAAATSVLTRRGGLPAA